MLDRVEIHPGVFRSPGYGSMVYRGTAEALVAAGVVEQSQLPGQPGNPKTMCTFTPDGRRAGRGTGNYCGAEPGRKRIFKDRNGFTVDVQLSLDLIAAAEAEKARLQACWPFPLVGGMAFLQGNA